MFAWWRRRRRRKILAEPIPAGFRAILHANVGHLRWLSEQERRRLEDLTRVFLAEKQFEGCGGLELTDEIRVTIAANACLLLLGRDDDSYARVQSILVYPSTVLAPERPRSLFDTSVRVEPGRRPLLGEAHLDGPVLVVWDAVVRGSRHPRSGHNVVFHEFAHQLDWLDRAADGTPPLGSRAEYARWAEVCGAVFRELRERVQEGRPTFLDPYAAESESEFFAVATEHFFEQPGEMQREHPELYRVLGDFYRQDPAARMARGPAPA